MTGWWRSNAVALCAIAVLVPATVLTMSWNEWAEIRANSATEPLTVAPGDDVSYGGAVVGPATAAFEDLPLPPSGTRVVSVTVRVDPGENALACLTPTLREVDGAGRRWQASDDLGREWDADRRTFCSSEATGPYDLELDYLVPTDAPGPFVVELESGDELPAFVSAVVAP